MTVYAVQVPHYHDKESGKWIPKIDIHSAAKYGNVVELISPKHVHAALVTQPTLAVLRRALKDYSDEDYIWPVGDICLSGMAIAVAAEANRGRVRLLRWSRDKKEHDIVTLNLRG